MRSLKVLQRYLNPVGTDLQLVGIKSQVDNDLGSNFPWLSMMRLEEFKGNLIIHLQTRMEDSLITDFGEFVSTLDAVSAGLYDSQEALETTNQESDFRLKFADLVAGTAPKGNDVRDVMLIVPQGDDRWKVTKDQVKLRNGARYVLVELTCEVPLGDTGVYPITFTFMYTETKSDLYSFFTPVINQRLTTRDAMKVIALSDFSSISLVGAYYEAPSGVSSTLYPVDTSFGTSYSQEKDILSVGSFNGTLSMAVKAIEEGEVYKSTGGNSYTIKLTLRDGTLYLNYLPN